MTPRTPRVFRYGDTVPADVTRMRDAQGEPTMCWHRRPNDTWFYATMREDPAHLHDGAPALELSRRWFPMTEVLPEPRRWARIPEPDDTVTKVHQANTGLTWTRAPGATYWMSSDDDSARWENVLALGDVEEVLPEPEPEPAKARVVLFKASGKYHTEEEWTIPTFVPHPTRLGITMAATGPYDMRHSPDFRRIDGGAVLVESQDPWGYPHLFPGEPA